MLSTQDLQLSDVCSVSLYINDMTEYATLNKDYVNIMSFPNPPSRGCVECPLPEGVGVILEALAYKAVVNDPEFVDKHSMHIQGISHWAPANIGPYSQAVRVSFWFNIV